MKKIFIISSVVVMVTGIIMVCGGIWGIYFTHKNIAQEKITTPADASIPEKKVSGPLTLNAQVDIIRKHTLESTEHKMFSEMDRNDPARNIWVTATTLTTALNLGILSYAFSTLSIVLGCISIWNGIMFIALAKRQ